VGSPNLSPSPPYLSQREEAITVSQAVSILLDEARAHRAQAKRAKRLAGDITAPDVVRSLLDYAQALDRLAVETEERAFALIEATAKLRAKNTGMDAPIAEAAAQIPLGERPATPPSTNGGAGEGGE
jgi:hypothetical protein